MRHYLIAGVLVIVLAVATYAGLMAIHLMPVEASAQSIPIDHLWNIEIAIISFLFALIIVPLVYSLFVFRRKKGDTSDGEHIEGNTTLEVTWTVIPLITVLVLAYMGTYTLGEVLAVDPSALVINVTARQWSWEFDYTEGFSSKELHLPVNRQVVLDMQSTDVIHSFFVPQFRMKQDVLPGRITTYRVTPILIGTYEVECAQLCGTSHSYMTAPVIVSSEADYDAWIQKQVAAAAAAAQTPLGRGQQLVAENGCTSCHSIDGSSTGIAPTWKGLYMSQVKLSGGTNVAPGTVVTANEAYLTESIVNPSAKIVDGFQDNVMPKTFGTALTQSQISDIVTYIESLK
ncbi:MAG TPA: cytochrome c oxidase subunit II [Anaerolineales bacterium]|nr:cytochrome c oxidase subunit II [Anaerolineales bacterium]